MIVDSLRGMCPELSTIMVSPLGALAGWGTQGSLVSLRFWGLVVSVGALRIKRGCRVHAAP